LSSSPPTASTGNSPSPTRCSRCCTSPTRRCGRHASASTTSTSPSCRSGPAGGFTVSA
jgi:hypothetical protein